MAPPAVHGQRDVAAGRVVHHASNLSPAGVGEDALDRVIDFNARLVLAHSTASLAASSSRRWIMFPNVVEHLGAVVRGLRGPLARGGRLPRRCGYLCDCQRRFAGEFASSA